MIYFWLVLLVLNIYGGFITQIELCRFLNGMAAGVCMASIMYRLTTEDLAKDAESGQA